jgi:uncharacterized protein YkwD
MKFYINGLFLVVCLFCKGETSLFAQGYDVIINPASYNQNLLDMAIFRATNDIRKQYGLAPLAKDPILDRMANLHAQQMKKYGFFDHANPYNKQFGTLSKRIEAVTDQSSDYVMLAENIAQYDLLDTKTTFCYDFERGSIRYYHCKTGQTIYYFTYRNFAKAVVADWMASPGHRQNILNKQYTLMGTAVAIFTQNSTKLKLPSSKIVQNFGKIL